MRLTCVTPWPHRFHLSLCFPMEVNSSKAHIPCHHCGDSCPNEEIRSEDGHYFCCRGCRSVYEILDGAGMTQYYSGEAGPGMKMSDVPEGTYSYLDEPVIQQSLLLFQEEDRAKVRWHLPAIHCSSCIWLLEHLHRLKEGVIAVSVDFSKRTALLTFDPTRISLRELAETLHGIGYPPRISLADEEEDSTSDRSLILKIGIIGFLFGNIMLLSFPEYLSVDDVSLEKFRPYFTGIILLLSLPVFFYGAKDYLVSALASLRHGRTTIDVPIAIGVTAIFLRSIYAMASGEGPGYMDSMAGLIFFLLIGRWYQGRVYSSLSFDRDFRSYFPLSVKKLFPDGSEQEVQVMQLLPGDIIRVRHQGIIPCDAILKQGRAEVDYSFVTGESRPVRIAEGEAVQAGGRNLGALMTVQVERKVSQSYLVELWNQPAFGKKSAGMSVTLDKAAGYFTVAILAIALFTGIYWYMTEPSVLLDAVTSVLIIACPCALALSVPFAFGNARRWMAKVGLYMKGVEGIEAMGSVDTLVWDKTGTITHSSEDGLSFDGGSMDDELRSAIRSLASQSAHPVSRAISRNLDGVIRPVEEFKEETGAGISGKLNGRRIKLGSASYLGLDGGTTGTHVSVDEEYLGSFDLEAVVRPGLPDILRGLASRYQLILLSGDDAKDAAVMSSFFKEEDMHFQQRPADKLRFIERLQSEGHRVMMIGDGLNDAGALKQSDVGLAVSDDADLFTPACDGILEGRSAPLIADILNYVGRAHRVVRWSILFSILYNVVGLSFAVQGLLTPLIAAILMPLSSVTIVVLATLGSTWAFQRVGLGSTLKKPTSSTSSSSATDLVLDTA